MAQVLGFGVGMHGGIELGIGMAVMAHTGVTIANLTFAVDAHYHHLTDDVVAGRRLPPPDGSGRLAPPEGPGWGVVLDQDKVGKYRRPHESGRYRNLYVDSAGPPDGRRLGWYPVMPAW